jgi:hypothetical protein
MRLSHFAIAIGIIALAGSCASGPIEQIVADEPPAATDGETPAASPPAESSCRADEFQGLIGQPRSAIDETKLPAQHRIVCHDCQVTMDYFEGRLNINLDAQGNVASLGCG